MCISVGYFPSICPRDATVIALRIKRLGSSAVATDTVCVSITNWLRYRSSQIRNGEHCIRDDATRSLVYLYMVHLTLHSLGHITQRRKMINELGKDVSVGDCGLPWGLFIFNVSWGVVTLSPRGTSATYCPIVPAPNDPWVCNIW